MFQLLKRGDSTDCTFKKSDWLYATWVKQWGCWDSLTRTNWVGYILLDEVQENAKLDIVETLQHSSEMCIRRRKEAKYDTQGVSSWHNA